MKSLLATVLLTIVIAPMAGAQDLKADLMAIEKTLWTAWGKKDGEPTKKHVTEDAVMLVAGTAPVAGRAAIVKTITTLPCELRSFDFQDPTLRQLTSDVVALSYTATQDATCEGQKLPARIRSTSIYVRQNGKWMQASYQETPVE
jgi:uncharacterized protein (TIGR02246 family)